MLPRPHQCWHWNLPCEFSLRFCAVFKKLCHAALTISSNALSGNHINTWKVCICYPGRTDLDFTGVATPSSTRPPPCPPCCQIFCHVLQSHALLKNKLRPRWPLTQASIVIFGASRASWSSPFAFDQGDHPHHFSGTVSRESWFLFGHPFQGSARGFLLLNM